MAMAAVDSFTACCDRNWGCFVGGFVLGLGGSVERWD